MTLYCNCCQTKGSSQPWPLPWQHAQTELAVILLTYGERYGRARKFVFRRELQYNMKQREKEESEKCACIFELEVHSISLMNSDVKRKIVALDKLTVTM